MNINTIALDSGLSVTDESSQIGDYDQGMIRAYVNALKDLDTSLCCAAYDLQDDLEDASLNIRQKIEKEIRDEYAEQISLHMISHFEELLTYIEDKYSIVLKNLFKEE